MPPAQALVTRSALLPQPAQDAWSLQRRLESLGDEEFVGTSGRWVLDMGDPARRALLLCAGSRPNPGLTISGRERRQRLSALALNLVAQGLASDVHGEAWRAVLAGALEHDGQTGSSPASPLGGQGAQAAMHVVSDLQLAEYAESVAVHMQEPPSKDGAVAGPDSLPSTAGRCALLLHDEAQACLFQLYGVWFASRDEFLAFPRPPAGQAAPFRRAFAEGAGRESELALQLLQARAESGQDLLSHPDAHLRGKAVQRLIQAVGEQSLSPSTVRQSLADSVQRESNPDVSDAMLQGLLDLALAAGPDGQAVHDLRATLQDCATGAPIALVPSLLSAFERLPRLEGEAGRAAAAQDGASAHRLLESLWGPALRLDRDTTILALRAWSRVQAKLAWQASEVQPGLRAGELVLKLMADPSEPERVRLVAAEALQGCPLGQTAMGQILSTLASQDSTASLRRAAYPLVIAGLQRLNWQALQGQGLVDSLLRDMGHGDVDLRSQAISVAGHALLIDRISALEAEQGKVLPILLGLLERETSGSVQAGLMDLIIQVANTTARPDLLAKHFERPRAIAWVVGNEIELGHLARTYQTLAGVGRGALCVQAALTWVRASQGLSHGPQVREQALAMALAIDQAEAGVLPLGTHRALYEMALQHLLNLPRAKALAWSQSYGDRMLSTHIAALSGAPAQEGEASAWRKTAWLEAKLLAAAVVEDDGAVRAAFDAALSQSQGDVWQRAWVLRDRARFLESFGGSEQAQAEWSQLAHWMSQQALELALVTHPAEMDFEDLGHVTSAAQRAKLFKLACRLWLQRTSDPAWKTESPGSCLGELNSWAQAAEGSQDPENMQAWLEFVDSQVQLSDGAGGWLVLAGAERAAFAARIAKLQAVVDDWATIRESSSGSEDLPEESDTGGSDTVE